MKKEMGMNGSQQVVIETPQLLIKGNIMSWYGTMIQLSNVSCISTRTLIKTEFPMFSIVLFAIGLLALKFNLLFTIIFCGIGAAWIYYWYKTNEQRKENTLLNIIMNSGENLQFIIYDRVFLDKILEVLEQIIIDGGVGKQNVSINIRECTFDGNAKVLNDLDLS